MKNYRRVINEMQVELFGCLFKINKKLHAIIAIMVSFALQITNFV